MKTCPGCQSPLLQTGGPHWGPRWEQYECGAVWHKADDDLSRTLECCKRENQALRADLDTLNAAVRR